MAERFTELELMVLRRALFFCPFYGSSFEQEKARVDLLRRVEAALAAARKLPPPSFELAA